MLCEKNIRFFFFSRFVYVESSKSCSVCRRASLSTYSTRRCLMHFLLSARDPSDCLLGRLCRLCCWTPLSYSPICVGCSCGRNTRRSRSGFMHTRRFLFFLLLPQALYLILTEFFIKLSSLFLLLERCVCVLRVHCETSTKRPAHTHSRASKCRSTHFEIQYKKSALIL